ncbi:hypothetical protein [Micromonospora sp. NPDC049497]|uniref:hypothetical protein n=1 Tax=Micromonospora sp. NPDC049497 TaxID=3364273 RepID=UPI0037A07ECB
MNSFWVSALVWLTLLEPGDAATWIGALANIATVVLATVASAVGFRVYKIESGRDARAEQERRERTEDERRSQASRVSVWYAFGDRGVRAPRVGTVQLLDAGPAWGGRILNASDLPIYDVFISFYEFVARGDDQPTWTRYLSVVPPAQGVIYADPQEGQNPRRRNADLQNLSVSLDFRDAAGRHWRRDRNGHLIELSWSE